MSYLVRSNKLLKGFLEEPKPEPKPANPVQPYIDDLTKPRGKAQPVEASSDPAAPYVADLYRFLGGR